MARAQIVDVTGVEQLEAIVGVPLPAVAGKLRTRLLEFDRAFLAATSFCVIATADAKGRCDASPKGDPPGGLVHVIDDVTIAIAERPGNRLAYGYRNILENPHVGIDFLIGGRGDTLRINGRARIVADAPFFDAMVVKGHRPKLAILVTIEEVFNHCPKALIRAGLWDPESWHPDAAPSMAQIVHATTRPDEPLEKIEEYYGPGYAERVYREPPRSESHPV